MGTSSRKSENPGYKDKVDCLRKKYMIEERYLNIYSKT